MVLTTDDPKEKLLVLSTSIGLNSVCWWDINGLANSSLHSPICFRYMIETPMVATAIIVKS